jgi:RNA polymerase sigma-70 factor, ECF subfamily
MSRSRLWPASRQLDSLVAAARAGSPEAIGSLLAGCRAYLLAVAARELGADLRGKLGASDLVQETFVQAHQSFAQFRGDCELELIKWLRTILLRQILATRKHYQGSAKRDIARELNRDGDSSVAAVVEALSQDSGTPSDHAAATEDALWLKHAIRSLPEDYQQVLTLRYWERLTFVEIGQRMARSSGATRKLWLRAMEQLERHLST